MQNDRHRLEAILNDAGSTAAEKAIAQAQLAILEQNDAPSGDFFEETLPKLLAEDGSLGFDDEILRVQYLADPNTDIAWAQLYFWRVRLESKSTILRAFAERMILMFAEYELIPTDVRQAATDFLGQYRKRKPGDPLPEIKIPGNELWETMPDDELYFEHMVPYKKRFTTLFYSPR